MDISSVPELIDKFGGAAAFGRVIGKGPSTASEMKRRGSIPVEYWPTVARAAREHGIRGITYEKLVALHIGEENLARASG